MRERCKHRTPWSHDDPRSIMSRAHPILDEQTLAAYLSNRLSPSERADVTAALIKDPEARELLKMALYALRGADRPPIPAATMRDADERVTRQPAGSDRDHDSSRVSNDQA